MTTKNNDNDQVRIYAKEIGQRFGHRGVVSAGGRVVHTTPALPFGFTDEARRRAARWAHAHGYRVDPAHLAPPMDLSRSGVKMPGKVEVAVPGKSAMPGKVAMPWSTATEGK